MSPTLHGFPQGKILIPKNATVTFVNGDGKEVSQKYLSPRDLGELWKELGELIKRGWDVAAHKDLTVDTLREFFDSLFGSQVAAPTVNVDGKALLHKATTND